MILMTQFNLFTKLLMCFFFPCLQVSHQNEIVNTPPCGCDRNYFLLRAIYASAIASKC